MDEGCDPCFEMQLPPAGRESEGAGGPGWRSPTAAPTILTKSFVKSLAIDEMFRHDAAMQSLAVSLRDVPVAGGTPPPLSPRQRQTLDLLLEAASEKQVASRLGISRHTVHVYVKSIYRAFGVSCRSELLVRCLKPGLKAPEETYGRSTE